MNHTPKPWRISVPILLVLFFGGGYAGEQLASVLAADAALAKFIGFFTLPTAMVLGFVFWLGTASLIALKRGINRNDKQRKVQRENLSWGQAAIPPGSKAFVIASTIPCVIVGSLLGVISTEYGFVMSFVTYTGMGIVYGVLCWKAAEKGYLPFPNE